MALLENCGISVTDLEKQKKAGDAEDAEADHEADDDGDHGLYDVELCARQLVDKDKTTC